MSIKARDVRRTFGEHVAIDHADVDVAPGRITGLIGPNGCGKTTLLLVLAGLLAPDSGTVEVAGSDPAADGPRARARIGWMPDHVGTWETLTSWEIVAAFGRVYGLPRDVAGERATELLAEVGLSDFAGSRVRVLSRGQKQRLSLARALVHDPAVLLLDEPASGLDPDSRVALRGILRRRADAGAAIIVSSHILPELEEMVDDVIMMRDGRTLAPSSGDGTPMWRLEVAGGGDADLRRWAEAEDPALGIAVGAASPDDGPRLAWAEFAAGPEAASAALARALAAGVVVASFGRRTLESRYLEWGANE
ncbi:ABC transporter ATP-binding protein [Corynebacterium hansenii]|uniref:ABC transporter ATP-binding protein n=1 Tax=Corynebacterium hansenii TaxID=394964 RepID=A0ABV7ZS65_9CORY|nr:ABC transporter ATP-binding protein [Corynebacterium hansenii]WJY99703.1 putative ABC transporter ATP-binding protein YxlF [Corynebacterium hansenii]